MNFEEQFPELKGKLESIEFVHNKMDRERYLPVVDKSLFYKEVDVKEFCLSKQRVKEARDELRQIIYDSYVVHARERGEEDPHERARKFMKNTDFEVFNKALNLEE